MYVAHLSSSFTIVRPFLSTGIVFLVALGVAPALGPEGACEGVNQTHCSTQDFQPGR